MAPPGRPGAVTRRGMSVGASEKDPCNCNLDASNGEASPTAALSRSQDHEFHPHLQATRFCSMFWPKLGAFYPQPKKNEPWNIMPSPTCFLTMASSTLRASSSCQATTASPNKPYTKPALCRFLPLGSTVRWLTPCSMPVHTCMEEPPKIK